MKVAKKGLSMLLALMMLFMLLPQMVLPARAEVTSGTCGDNLQWSLDSETGVLTITGTGDMWNWYSRNTDETFKMSPFAKKASIRSVILPDGLTRIGDNAFYFCSSLAEVTIPPSVKEIGSGSFTGCADSMRVNIQDLSAWCKKDYSISQAYDLYLNDSPVTDLIVPEDVTAISDNAFYQCESIVSVTIPDGVTSIGKFAFSACGSLKSVTILEGVESIGDSAFSQCNSLNKITLPASLKTIGASAFDNTAYYNLESNWMDGLLYLEKWLIKSKEEATVANVREGTLGIASGAFASQDKLESVNIPESVKYINGKAFCNCSGLKEVMLSDGLTEIGDSAFLGCTGLKSMTVPDSVTSIGKYAIGIAKIKSTSMGDEITKIPDFQIVGTKGSAAETYAKENDITFVELDEKSDTDMAALNTAIASADALKEADYTPESYAKVKEAVEAAKALPADADQASIDAAAKTLNDAIAALVSSSSETPKREDLNKAIASAAALKEADYTPESYAKVKEAADAAKALPADANQAAIDAATKALNDAIAALVSSSPETPEKEALTKAIAKAEAIDKTKYTEESVSVLEVVLASAKDALSSGTASEMEKAAQTLNAALEALKAKDAEKTNPFTDVKEGDYFYDAVLWAFYHEPQITDGMTDTTFGPSLTVTRGQCVTFLWRAMGKPEPTITKNPFTDVPASQYYYKAVLWAVEKGITDGMTDTTFEPNTTLSTAHIITFLYRTLGVGTNGWYQEAADWAVKEHLMEDMNLMVAPNVDCPRGAVVTFLYRELK